MEKQQHKICCRIPELSDLEDVLPPTGTVSGDIWPTPHLKEGPLSASELPIASHLPAKQQHHVVNVHISHSSKSREAEKK